MSTDATTYAHFLFNAFDIDRNGSIRFEDFVIGLSVLLRGSVTEKLNWAFNLYDINKDGYITKEVCVAYGVCNFLDMKSSTRCDKSWNHAKRLQLCGI